MCGRYSLKTSLDQIARRLGITSPWPLFAASANITPTQSIPVVFLSSSGQPEMQLMRWGLVPHWAGNSARFKPLINARCETLATRPSFRDAFRHRRCVIPADGFYEWATLPTGRKRPYLIRRADGQPLFMAGLYDLWQDSSGNRLSSTAVVTVPANSLIAPLHDRMPAILPDSVLTAWLDPHRSPPKLLALLTTAPEQSLHMTAVSRSLVSPAGPDSSPPTSTPPPSLFSPNS